MASSRLLPNCCPSCRMCPAAAGLAGCGQRRVFLRRRLVAARRRVPHARKPHRHQHHRAPDGAQVSGARSSPCCSPHHAGCSSRPCLQHSVAVNPQVWHGLASLDVMALLRAVPVVPALQETVTGTRRASSCGCGYDSGEHEAAARSSCPRSSPPWTVRRTKVSVWSPIFLVPASLVPNPWCRSAAGL